MWHASSPRDARPARKPVNRLEQGNHNPLGRAGFGQSLDTVDPKHQTVFHEVDSKKQFNEAPDSGERYSAALAVRHLAC